MSKEQIDHELLDVYVSVKGELEALTPGSRPDATLWTMVDELLLDLHMLRHGYATEGYGRYVERRLQEVCSDAEVVGRMKEIRL
jgi:hypothetical protein